MQDMQTKACTTLSEQEKMTDLLSGQKYLTSIYNGYCCEAATPSVKGCLSSIKLLVYLVRVYFWIVHSVSLICMFIPLPVPHNLEIGPIESSHFILLF